MTVDIGEHTALVIIDVQQAFENPALGRRDNPEAEANIAALASAWQAEGRPIVRVAHTDDDPSSPFAAGAPGHAFKPAVAGIEPSLDMRKDVHSAFHGTPDLHGWLLEQGIDQIVICGIQTNRCCDSTARDGGDLGYEVIFVPDAMHTFDKIAPDGTTFTAEQLSAATAATLHGYFATVATTKELLG